MTPVLDASPRRLSSTSLGAVWCGESHRSDLNRRPLDYESRALPLSYGGVGPKLAACRSFRYSAAFPQSQGLDEHRKRRWELPLPGIVDQDPAASVNVKLRVKVADRTITATVIESETSRHFVSLLPLTLTMNDLFRREKFGHHRHRQNRFRRGGF